MSKLTDWIFDLSARSSIGCTHPASQRWEARCGRQGCTYPHYIKRCVHCRAVIGTDLAVHNDPTAVNEMADRDPTSNTPAAEPFPHSW